MMIILVGGVWALAFNLAIMRDDVRKIRKWLEAHK